ncbi:MAG: hypothetical protein K6B52_07115 [Clostridiales bacterium]|nr:hypothetical protein [Clostridiales bacterium]
MTVNELSNNDFLTPVVICDAGVEISGVYIGDLLSWVMNTLQEGQLWVTIMSNINILAVASLKEASAIILAEGVKLPEDIQETAKAKGINVLSSTMPAYETAKKLSMLGF